MWDRASFLSLALLGLFKGFFSFLKLEQVLIGRISVLKMVEKASCLEDKEYLRFEQNYMKDM